MAKYKLSNEAKYDLIRIYKYEVKKFGETQADKYFNSFFECFNTIANRPFSFETVDYIKSGYRRCPCGVDSIYYKLNNENIVEIMAIVRRQDLKTFFEHNES
ncbi:type II toxin-antitoxin system RelE/ParE family toxin [Aquimarina agarilytica]|uniref:type II toxin-antitoxin system RelE/ParE family toxin n=1 Tax=Aquimarina agarilytica TaxID=1087449 RepID=UPI00028A0A73|nr:type II toxin-antitoxin system RelE/ParE family toxin [Aquimarina agarilytica]